MPVTNINEVFNYNNPIAPSENERRAYVGRPKLAQAMDNNILKEGVLIVSGYSGIGKTTLIYQTLNPDSALGRIRFSPTIQNQREKPNYGLLVTVSANDFRHQDVYPTVYRKIEHKLGVKDRIADVTNISADSLAARIHLANAVVVVDNFQILEGRAAEELYLLCKRWSDYSFNASNIKVPQSKIILVAPAHQLEASQWIEQQRRILRERLSCDYVWVEPWSLRELTEILRQGASKLGIMYDEDIEGAITRISCGLPNALNFLAAHTAIQANNGQLGIQPRNKVYVRINDLDGVLGEHDRIRGALNPLNDVDSVSDTAGLCALCYMAVHGGKAAEAEVGAWLERFDLLSANSADWLCESVLADFVDCQGENGQHTWALKDLACGTVAFIRLHLKRFEYQQDYNIDAVFQDLLDQPNGDEEDNGFMDPLIGQALPFLLIVGKLAADKLRQIWKLDAPEAPAAQPAPLVAEAGAEEQLSQVLAAIKQSRGTASFEHNMRRVEEKLGQIRQLERRIDVTDTQRLDSQISPVDAQIAIERYERDIQKKLAEIKRILEDDLGGKITVENQ